MKSKTLIMAAMLFGFISANAEVNPGNGKKEDVNGTVLQADSKKPLKDVSITAYSSSGKEKATVTAEDGTFAFDELKPGKYKFIFEKTGYRKVTKEAVIAKTDDAYPLNVEMTETKDYILQPSPFHFPGYH
jgi:hypothetical protein